MNHDLDAAAEQMRQLVIIVTRVEGMRPVGRATHMSLWLSLGTMSGILGVSNWDIIPRNKTVRVSLLEQLSSLFVRREKEDEDAVLMDLWKRGQAVLTVLMHLVRVLNPQRADDFSEAKKILMDYLDLAAFAL